MNNLQVVHSSLIVVEEGTLKKAGFVVLLAIGLLLAAGMAHAGWSWTLSTSGTNPSHRGGHVMAYDTESDRVILFGGWAGEYDPRIGRLRGEESNETWAYDANTDTWTNVTVPGPPPRTVAAMAYDSESDRIVLFGGATGPFPSSEFGDTWTYDYDSRTWTNMSPANGPPSRRAHAAAYDAQSDRVIIFSGYIGKNDTWAYDDNTNTWTNMAPPVFPSGGWGLGMAYDSQSDLVVLFRAGRARNQTWTYDVDGNTWTNRTDGHGPPGRVFSAIAYDAHSDRTIVFGGLAVDSVGAETPLSDTWAYDANDNAWSNMTPNVGPSPRSALAGAYDSESDRFVTYGGQTSWTNVTNETWTYSDASPENPPTSWPLVVGAAALLVAGATTVVALAIVRRRKRGPQGERTRSGSRRDGGRA